MIYTRILIHLNLKNENIINNPFKDIKYITDIKYMIKLKNLVDTKRI